MLMPKRMSIAGRKTSKISPIILSHLNKPSSLSTVKEKILRRIKVNPVRRKTFCFMFSVNKIKNAEPEINKMETSTKPRVLIISYVFLVIRAIPAKNKIEEKIIILLEPDRKA